jgi:hypothetical protein
VDFSVTQGVACQRPPVASRRGLLLASSEAFCQPILTGWATNSFGDSLTLPAEAGRGRNSARGVSRCTIKTPLLKI